MNVPLRLGRRTSLAIALLALVSPIGATQAPGGTDTVEPQNSADGQAPTEESANTPAEVPPQTKPQSWLQTSGEKSPPETDLKPAVEPDPDSELAPDEARDDEAELESEFESAEGDDWGDVALDFDIGAMSLEELMDIDVTIASRTEQGLRSTPAAVYVLTGDEIRRSGHSSIPEALRMVPGFYVSRWSHTTWDVTSRGFGTGLALTNLAYLNQLLVLIDGVVVYSPLFAGVWWPMQDLDMRDVERIEVVRGPGGFLWGANGVHGVVHIITKQSSETQGGRVYVRTSNDEVHSSVRWGGKISENAHFRAWVDYADYEPLARPFLDIASEWNLTNVGFRTDWTTDSGRDVTIWARTQEGEFDELAFDLQTFDPFLGDGEKDGRTLFASLEDDEEGWHVQTWWTRDRQDYPTFLDIDIDTFDVEYVRQIPVSDAYSLSWGLGYRRIESTLIGDDPFFLDFDPRRVEQNNFRAFLMNTYDVSEELQFVVGTQLEYTEFTNFEIQPTARALWSPSTELNFWAAASRPVRTPSLEERTLSPDSAVAGNPAIDSEHATIYELGARRQFGDSVGVDLAFYYNEYEDLLFDEDQQTFQLSNDAEGEAYGAEAAIDLVATESWSLRTAYSYFEGDFRRASDGTLLDTDNQSPRHAFNVRSYYDLAEDWEFDTGFYVVEDLGPGFEAAEYDRIDARLGWRANDHVRLSVGVQNLNGSLRSELDEFDNNRRQFYFEVEMVQ